MFRLQDFTYGWRQLSASPGFLVVAVTSLALGIGANAAIFSLLNGVLLKKLPVRDPGRLVLFTDPGSSGVSIGSTSGDRPLLSYPEFMDLRREATLFEGVCAAESSTNRLNARVDDSQEEVNVKLVSGSYFSVLGVDTAAGRFFDNSLDTQIGATPFAVISDAFWSRRFGRSPDAVGRTILLGRVPLTIVAVAARNFNGESVGQTLDLWAPLSMEIALKPGRDWLHPLPDPSEKAMWLHVIGRLKPGVTLQQANLEANQIFLRNLKASYQSLSAESQKRFLDQKLKLTEAPGGASELRDRFAESLYVVLAAVGITLLISCANLTNLLLARANTRRREITVRLALGASRNRIVAQLFAESLLLSLMGAAAGLLIASVTAPLLVHLASNGPDEIGLDTRIDLRVLAFTGVVSILTTLIFGLAPALRAARIDINSTLREGSRGTTATASRLRLGKFVVMGQVALSAILLVGSGLLLRTLLNLQNADLGYARDHLITLRVDGLSAGYERPRLPAFYKQIAEKLEATPGVKKVTYSENGLFGGTDSGDTIFVEGYTSHSKTDRGSRWDVVAPGFFTDLGVPIILGRDIKETDQPGGPTVCVINEAFAKLFFSGRNPIGKHITTEYGDKKTALEIVGVAKNSRDHNLRGEVPHRFFIALAQTPAAEMPGSLNFEVRTAGNPGPMIQTLRKAVNSVDSNALILNARSFDETISLRVGQDRILANLTIIFGGLALTLAAIGIYGVLSYGVVQRRNEIGIRIAVGAGAQNLLAMILRETMTMVAIGLGVGLVGSFWVSQLIRSRLVGLEPTDPLVLVTSAAILLLFGLFSAAVPAWRASRVDPSISLRYD